MNINFGLCLTCGVWKDKHGRCNCNSKDVNWNTVIVPIIVAIFILVSSLSPLHAQSTPQVPPTPTVGEPARIERVYLPLVMTDSASMESLVNWNSKRTDGEIGTYGGWQARGN